MKLEFAIFFIFLLVIGIIVGSVLQIMITGDVAR